MLLKGSDEICDKSIMERGGVQTILTTAITQIFLNLISLVRVVTVQLERGES